MCKCALSREQLIHKPSIAFLYCKQYTSFIEQLVIKKGIIKMSESNEEIKKMEARIAKLDEQQKQLKAKKRVLRNRLSQQARKARTNRLIEKGTLLEKLLDDHGDVAQTEKELQQLLSAENRYQELKQFTSKIKYQDQSTVFQHFVQEIKSR